MAIYFSEIPADYSLSKNHAIYKAFTTADYNSVDVVMYYSVQVADRSDPTGWRTVASNKQRFNQHGVSEIDIADTADAALSYFVPTPFTVPDGSNYVVWKEQCKRFRITFVEYINGTPQGDGPQDYKATAPVHILKGGYPKEQWRRDMAPYLFGGKPLAKLDNREVIGNQALHPAQLCFATMLCRYGYDPAGPITVTNSIFYHVAASSGIAYNISDYEAGDVIVFNCYPEYADDIAQVFLNATYDVDADPVIEWGWQRDKNQCRARQLLYLNSLGGAETIMLPHNEQKQSEQEFDTNEIVPAISMDLYEPRSGAEVFMSQRRETIRKAIDTGAMSISELERLREVLLSPVWFEVFIDLFYNPQRVRYIPSLLTSKKNLLRSAKGERYLALELELTEAFSNSSIAPLDTDCCNPVGSRTAIYIPLQGSFKLLIDTTDAESGNTEIGVTTNSGARYLVDYGNGVIEERSTDIDPVYEYANGEPRLMTIGYYLRNSITELGIDAAWLKQISDTLPPELKYLAIGSSIFESLPKLPCGLETLIATDCLINTMPKLPTGLKELQLQNNELEIPLKPDSTLPELFAQHDAIIPWPAGLKTIRLDGNMLSSTNVDIILLAIDETGLINGTLKLEGQTPAAPPTGTGLINKLNLVGKGWTVTHD